MSASLPHASTNPMRIARGHPGSSGRTRLRPLHGLGEAALRGGDSGGHPLDHPGHDVVEDRHQQLGCDVVWRTVLPRPQGSVVYELTDYGRDLDGIVLALGKWGARTMGDPGPDDIVTPDSLVMALRSTFHPDAAATLRAGYELRIGDIVLNAKVDHGILEMGVGPLPDADLIIDGVSGDAGPVLKALFARELTPAQALETGAIRIGGNPGLLAQFIEMFRI